MSNCMSSDRFVQSTDIVGSGVLFVACDYLDEFIDTNQNLLDSLPLNYVLKN